MPDLLMVYGYETMTKLVHAEQNQSLEDEEVLGFLHTSFTSIIADKTPED